MYGRVYCGINLGPRVVISKNSDEINEMLEIKVLNYSDCTEQQCIFVRISDLY